MRIPISSPIPEATLSATSQICCQGNIASGGATGCGPSPRTRHAGSPIAPAAWTAQSQCPEPPSVHWSQILPCPSSPDHESYSSTMLPLLRFLYGGKYHPNYLTVLQCSHVDTAPGEKTFNQIKSIFTDSYTLHWCPTLCTSPIDVGKTEENKIGKITPILPPPPPVQSMILAGEKQKLEANNYAV